MESISFSESSIVEVPETGLTKSLVKFVELWKSFKPFSSLSSFLPSNCPPPGQTCRRLNVPKEDCDSSPLRFQYFQVSPGVRARIRKTYSPYSPILNIVCGGSGLFFETRRARLPVAKYDNFRGISCPVRCRIPAVREYEIVLFDFVLVDPVPSAPVQLHAASSSASDTHAFNMELMSRRSKYIP